MGSFFRGAEAFAYDLRRTLTHVERVYGSRGTKLIWMMPHAVQASKSNAAWKYMNGPLQQKQFRDIMLNVIGEATSMFHVVDPFGATWSRPDLTEDGNHYRTPVNEYKLDSVLHFLCNGPVFRT